MRVFKKAWLFISLAALLGLPTIARAQGWAIQGQAVDAKGKPISFGLVRVCPYTASGAPCSPLTSLWSDIPKTHTISNPYTTDATGNYSFVVTTGQSYIVQVFVSTNFIYSYLYTAGNAISGAVIEVNSTPISPSSPANLVDTASVTWAFTGGQIKATAAGGGGGSPAPPQFSVQFNNPLGTFAGSGNFTYNPVGFVFLNDAQDGSTTKLVVEAQQDSTGGVGTNEVLVDGQTVSVFTDGGGSISGGSMLGFDAEESDANYPGGGGGNLTGYQSILAVSGLGRDVTGYESAIDMFAGSEKAGTVRGFQVDDDPSVKSTNFYGYYAKLLGADATGDDAAFYAKDVAKASILSNYCDIQTKTSDSFARLSLGCGQNAASTFGGPVSVDDGSGKAGFVGLSQGTSQSTVANEIGFTAPTSVTAYNMIWPGAQWTGCLSNDGSGNLSGTSCGGGGTLPTGYGIPTIENGATWGPTIPEVPAEAYGAVGNASCSAASDSTTALQNAINSLSTTGGLVRLQPLCYKINSALSITHSNVGIVGFNNITSSPTLFSDYPASILYQTSASADIIDVAGSGTSANVSGNRIANVSLQRATIPTGTASGLSLNFTYSAVVDHVTSADSIRDFYIHASGSLATGIFNSAATWGYNGVSETSGSLYGFYLDSADGTASPSMFYRNPAVFNVTSGTTTYGFYVNGAAINDIDVTNLNAATTDWGIYVNYTGGGGVGTASDLHFWNSTIDSMKTGCIYVNGIPESAYGSVEFSGGWCGGPATITNIVDIEGSNGVTVQNMQLSDAAATNIVTINGGGGNTISGDNMVHVPTVGVNLNATTLNNIVGNTMRGYSATTGIALASTSTYNNVSKNVLAGTFGTGIATADSASNNNSGFADNTFGTGVSTSYNEASHGNNNPTINGASPGDLVFTVNNNTCNSSNSAGVRIEMVGSAAVATGIYTLCASRTPSGVVKPLQTYFGSANGLTNGMVFNTETTAPLVFATNSTPAITVDGTTQEVTVNSSLASFNVAPSGGTNGTINFGTNFGALDIVMYDGGAAQRYGWGLTAGTMNFVVPSLANLGGHVVFTDGGDLGAGSSMLTITRAATSVPTEFDAPLYGAGTLANGMTATTQSANDASTDVATDNFVTRVVGISNAITSATGGSGTGTITCVTASCTNLRGSYTVDGGTFATGTLLTLVWPTTTTAYVCTTAVLNNATGASIGYHGVATATGMTISSLTAATGLSIDIDYSCQP